MNFYLNILETGVCLQTHNHWRETMWIVGGTSTCSDTNMNQRKMKNWNIHVLKSSSTPPILDNFSTTLLMTGGDFDIIAIFCDASLQFRQHFLGALKSRRRSSGGLSSGGFNCAMEGNGDGLDLHSLLPRPVFSQDTNSLAAWSCR